MMRHLLGSDKKVVHDPGPKGESGEGDACLVMMFLVIAAAGLIMIYGASFPAAGSLTQPSRPLSLHPLTFADVFPFLNHREVDPEARRPRGRRG